MIGCFLLGGALLTTVVPAERPQPINIGYAIVQTVAAPAVQGDSEHFVPRVFVRMYNLKEGRESFGVSNQDGMLMVPLRPGSYCFEAFNRKGMPLELTSSQKRCFELTADRDVDVGVELSSSNPTNK